MKRARRAEADRPFDEKIRRERERATREHCGHANPCGRRADLDDGGEREDRPMPEIQRVADEADPDENIPRKNLPVEPAVRTGRDQQKRADRRKQRPCAGKREVRVEQRDRKSECAPRLRSKGRRRTLRGIGFRRWFPIGAYERQQASELQLPETAQRRIEGGDGRQVNRRQVDCEREHADRNDEPSMRCDASSRTTRAPAARRGRTALRCRATTSAAAVSSDADASKYPASFHSAKFETNPMPAAMCLPSCLYSSGSSVIHPNAKHAARTTTNAGRIRLMRRA